MLDALVAGTTNPPCSPTRARTGWSIDEIRRKMNLAPGGSKPDDRKWWQKMD